MAVCTRAAAFLPCICFLSFLLSVLSATRSPRTVQERRTADKEETKPPVQSQMTSHQSFSRPRRPLPLVMLRVKRRFEACDEQTGACQMRLWFLPLPSQQIMWLKTNEASDSLGLRQTLHTEPHFGHRGSIMPNGSHAAAANYAHSKTRSYKTRLLVAGGIRVRVIVGVWYVAAVAAARPYSWASIATWGSSL